MLFLLGLFAITFDEVLAPEEMQCRMPARHQSATITGQSESSARVINGLQAITPVHSVPVW